MTPEEKNLITGLFQRLASADTRTKDAEADQLIQSLTAAQPSAPYLLAQTVLVQEHALQNAQAKISQLERQAADAASRSPQESRGGSFLSGLLHPLTPRPAVPAASAAGATASTPPPVAPPYPSTVGMQPSAAGGFLRGALSTAAGVAGGALLFEGIQNLLGHHAGPFGPSLGGMGGFGGGSGIEPVTENVTNNYYGSEPQGRDDASFLPANDDSGATPTDDTADVPPDQDQDLDLGTDVDAGADLDTFADDSGGGDGGDFV